MKRKDKILLIDDDGFTQGFFKNLLGDEGYGVTIAGDGDEGIRLFTQEIFGLVLLDLKIPGSMDGMQVLRRLKTMQPETVIIMISGHGASDVAVEAVKRGAEDFISKPFDSPEEILLRIEKALEHRDIRRELDSVRAQLEELQAPGMIDTSVRMQEVFKIFKEAAQADNSEICPLNYRAAKEMFEKFYLKNLLRACGGNITTTTARTSGLGRATLIRKLKKFQIEKSPL
ncbi:MAG: response regulator [bacterium]